MRLSIIIPVYNEEKTILELLQRVKGVNFGFEREIIIVDDGSTDDTQNLLRRLSKANLDKNLRVIFSSRNQGKGSALRRGFQQARGEIIAIQDADLEYNPEELPKLIQPILDGRTQVVYGSRFLELRQHKYRLYYLGNLLIAFLFRFLYSTEITDPPTCYKIFKHEILNRIPPLRLNGFEMEPEFTAKVIRAGYRILELPIKYHSRAFSEGKKINCRHAFKYIWAIVKYRFINK